MKKALCIALFLVLTLSCTWVAWGINTGTISVDDVATYPGKTIEVPIRILDNPGLIAVRFFITYDTDVLTLTNVADGELIGSGTSYFGNDLSEVPYTLLWEDGLSHDNHTADGVLATLTFTVADDAPVGETAIMVEVDAASTLDVDLNEVEIGTADGVIAIQDPGFTVTLDPNEGECGITAITAYTGEVYGVLPIPVREGWTFLGWFTQDDTEVTESTVVTATEAHTLYAHWQSAAVELAPQEESTAVIDTESSFIYGLDFNLTADQLSSSYLSVNGNGHLEFSSPTIGTGTKVSVINDNTGNVDATYTIVIFGDLNGDGLLNLTDITTMRNLAASLTSFEEGSPFLVAADVTHDGLTNSTDITTMRNASASLSSINQVV